MYMSYLLAWISWVLGSGADLKVFTTLRCLPSKGQTNPIGFLFLVDPTALGGSLGRSGPIPFQSRGGQKGSGESSPHKAV